MVHYSEVKANSTLESWPQNRLFWSNILLHICVCFIIDCPWRDLHCRSIVFHLQSLDVELFPEQTILLCSWDSICVILDSCCFLFLSMLSRQWFFNVSPLSLYLLYKQHDVHNVRVSISFSLLFLPVWSGSRSTQWWLFGRRSKKNWRDPPLVSFSKYLSSSSLFLLQSKVSWLIWVFFLLSCLLLFLNQLLRYLFFVILCRSFCSRLGIKIVLWFFISWE